MYVNGLTLDFVHNPKKCSKCFANKTLIMKTNNEKTFVNTFHMTQTYHSFVPFLICAVLSVDGFSLKSVNLNYMVTVLESYRQLCLQKQSQL